MTRTIRRLPEAPPAALARAQARGQAARRALAGLCGGLLLLLALAGLWSTLGLGPAALLFGDGSAGLSRTLLMLQLLAKPLVGALSAAAPQTLLAGLVVLSGGAWLWWWLVQRTPVYAVAEGRR